MRIWLIALHQLLANWFEWQDAKCWAKDIHPGWLQIATKSKNKETRAHYKAKILAAYRGEE